MYIYLRVEYMNELMLVLCMCIMCVHVVLYIADSGT